MSVSGGLFTFISQTNLTPNVTILWTGAATQTLDKVNYPVVPNNFGLTADFQTNHLVQFSVPAVSSAGDAMIFRLYGSSGSNYLEWDRTINPATLNNGMFTLDVLNEQASSSSGSVNLDDIQAITLSLVPLGSVVPSTIEFDFINAADPPSIPEPGSLALLGAVSVAALGYRYLRRRNAAGPLTA